MAQPLPVPTPTDLTITVRDRRFGRDRVPQAGHPRRWLAGDAVGSAWFAVLSATFPRGEAYFVESVKACREGAPPLLAEAIRGFIAQEINHTREHIVLNKATREAGYDLTLTERNVDHMLNIARGRPPIVNLAATAALEHFTAIIAHEVLGNPAHFARADPEVAALWRWHAGEEIEHKGVAFDLWRYATRDWSRWQRWRLRAALMLAVTLRFVSYRLQETMQLLAQDGVTGWQARVQLADYLLRRPGLLLRVFPAWLAWFAPGFHPWRVDDRALIEKPAPASPSPA